MYDISKLNATLPKQIVKGLLDRILTKLNHGFLVVLHRHEKVPFFCGPWQAENLKQQKIVIF